MKKNIFKDLACVLAVTLTLTSTGTVAFAAELGTEDIGGSSNGTFNFGNFWDMSAFTTEESATEESVVEESATEEPVVEEPVATVESVVTVEPVATAEPVATEEPVATAEPVVGATAAKVTVNAPVQTYSAKARSAKASNTQTYAVKTSSNGSFNLGDFWTIGSFNLGSFWDMLEKANNTPKEPEYVTVSTYYCNCSACFHTTDYNALKQHMFQHVIRGERNSYHTVVEKVLKQ